MNTELGIYCHKHNLIGLSPSYERFITFWCQTCVPFGEIRLFLYRATSYASTSRQIIHMKIILFISQTGTLCENERRH